MKRSVDDIVNWRMQQRNDSEPFPYVFPQMPPRFRRFRTFTKVLFLLEWSCCLTMILSGLVLLGFYIVSGRIAFDAFLHENTWIAFGVAVFFVSLPLGLICRLLRHTPKLFWHCPCCGLPFSYYAPSGRGADVLKEPDCLDSMEHLRIKYAKTRFCPLVVPSVCPACKHKFFDMADEPVRDW